MKKVLIIGSKGMAGHMIYEYLKGCSGFEVIDIARDRYYHKPTYQLDVTNFDDIRKIFQEEKLDVVINCIGVLNDAAVENPEKAILLNSYFPHFLAKCGKEVGFKLIHISTDCVFKGNEGRYTEESIKDGQGFYAQTKALGEINDGSNLTLRTSIIGPELKETGIGLFHWFMSRKGVIKGYRQAYWTGVTTFELAKAIVEAINQNISGLHHLVNDKSISKYALIKLVKEIFQKNDIEIEPYDNYKVDKSLVRTNYSFDYKVPSYQQMIEEIKDWIDSHPELYNNIYK